MLKFYSEYSLHHSSHPHRLLGEGHEVNMEPSGCLLLADVRSIAQLTFPYYITKCSSICLELQSWCDLHSSQSLVSFNIWTLCSSKWQFNSIGNWCYCLFKLHYCTKNSANIFNIFRLCRNAGCSRSSQTPSEDWNKDRDNQRHFSQIETVHWSSSCVQKQKTWFEHWDMQTPLQPSVFYGSQKSHYRTRPA